MVGTRRFTFPKEERLSWKRYIDKLFAEGESFVAFPLRVVYCQLEEPTMGVPAAMLVSVPKKKFRRAVLRNRIKRLTREAYRLRKQVLLDALEAEGKQLLIAFLYVDKELCSFARMDKAMGKALRLLQEKMA